MSTAAKLREELSRAERDGIHISDMKQPWDSALAGYFHALRVAIAIADEEEAA